MCVNIIRVFINLKGQLTSIKDDGFGLCCLKAIGWLFFAFYTVIRFSVNYIRIASKALVPLFAANMRPESIRSLLMGHFKKTDQWCMALMRRPFAYNYDGTDFSCNFPWRVNMIRYFCVWILQSSELQNSYPYTQQQQPNRTPKSATQSHMNGTFRAIHVWMGWRNVNGI